MTIEWNKVTWYSKILAVVLFVAVFFTGFILGSQYSSTSTLYNIYNPISDIKIVDNKNGDVSLKVDETGKKDDLQVTFTSVVQDSRCPIDVQCIQSGSVVINAKFSAHGKTINKNISLGINSEEFEGYKISVVSVSPDRKSKSEIKPDAYVVTFHVESGEKV
jgi:hypothetical protein